MYGIYFSFLKKFISYEKLNYLTDEKKFTKDRKMSYKDFIIYILGNRGKTSVLELDDFFRNKFRCVGMRRLMSVTKQNFSNRRQYIKPEFFKDICATATKEKYGKKEKSLMKFKGLYVFAIDGGELTVPNTPETREEFAIDLNHLEKVKTPKIRISVMSDAKNELIIDSSISSISTGESVLAFEHIEKSSKLVDLSQSIILFDRNYASSELILQILQKEGYFIFRLKSDTFKKERKNMKTDDEWVDITFTGNRRQNIKNKELKAKARELEHVNLRIVNIPLETGENETLLTNLPENIASPAELKNLYGERWQIEKGYDVLKNKLEIENFTGKKRLTIEQDFFSRILLYNILIEYKTKCNNELKKIPKYKNHKCEFKVNMNILAGKLKTSIYEMFLTDSEKERKLIEEDMDNIVKKNTIKVERKPSTSRNKKSHKQKYPYNNKRNS